MRYVLYYPMVHVSKGSQIESIRRLFAEEGVITQLNDNQMKALRFLSDIKSYHHAWREFTYFLRGERPFDRLYLEGQGPGMTPPLGENSGMKECIDFVVQSGARMETTENFFNVMGTHIFKRCGSLYDLFHRRRERFVVGRVDRTLKDGERGILLYGGGHKEGIVRHLRQKDLKFYVLGE